MDMILGKCKFPNSILPYFRKNMLNVHIGIALRRQFHCVPTAYVFSINDFCTISFFLNKSSTTFIYSKKLACRNERHFM